MTCQRQRGFTSIEMIMVISIIMVLMVMAGTAIVSSLRYAAFSRAVASVSSLAIDARTAALFAAGDENIGVELRPASTGGGTAVLLKGDAEIAGTERSIPQSIVLLSNGAALPGPVRWWYRPGSGRLMSRATGEQTGVLLGMPRPAMDEAPKPMPVDHILMQTGDEPGLELATRQGDLRVAMRIYPVGTMTTDRPR